mmetsp:Transcript_37251/g.69397  ORF Transcript_37251/g.69397 Transcript_37251/m.69397 type:complete len:505 (+) Transcript_37251:127-1641(+)
MQPHSPTSCCSWLPTLTLRPNLQPETPFFESSPLLFFLSFGAHAFRSVLPLLQVYFLNTQFVTPTGYALLLASQSLPALILPFFVGHIYDIFEFKYVTVCFLLIQFIGQLSFCFAVHLDNFPYAIASLIIFGSGSSAVSVAQRALVVDSYKGSEGFGIGCIHSISAVSKFIGKISIIPAVIFFDSYKVALLSMCIYTVFSLSIAFYMLCGRDAPSFHTYDADAPPPPLSEPSSPENRSRSASASIQSLGFWKSLLDKRVYLTRFFVLLATAHTVYLLVFHLLGNFLPHMLITRWHQSFSISGITSGFMSFLPAVISPFVGYFVDQIGMQLEVCTGAAMATTFAYWLLLYAPAVTPFIPIMLLSLSLAIIPTITLAIVPLCIPSDAYGLAYGSMEVIDSLGSMIGNYIFGEMFKQTHSYILGLTCLGVMSVIGVALFISLSWIERQGRGEVRGGLRLDRFQHVYETIPATTSFCSTSDVGTPRSHGHADFSNRYQYDIAISDEIL